MYPGGTGFAVLQPCFEGLDYLDFLVFFLSFFFYFFKCCMTSM